MTRSLRSRTSRTTWSGTATPSLAKVAYALAWESGLTSAVPRGMRSLLSQPAPLGAPTLRAILMILRGPLSIWVVKSTNAVLIEAVVALTRLTDWPYWWLDALRTGYLSPGGVQVLPLKLSSRLKPSFRPAARA